MVLADISETAPECLDPDCILPALAARWSFGHGYFILEFFCRYIFSVIRPVTEQPCGSRPATGLIRTDPGI